MTLEFSKVHSCGQRVVGQPRARHLLLERAQAADLGNWIYDNEGYGIQLYPNCDGARWSGNVVAENGGACDVGRAPRAPRYLPNGFCGFGRENGTRPIFPPIHCGPTAATRRSTWSSSTRPARGRHRLRRSKLGTSGTLERRPAVLNRAAYDFRMRNPFARAKLGIYAEIMPGPRW